MWNRRRKLVWLVLVSLAVMTAVLLSLPLLLNSANYKALLIRQAEAQLGRKVEIGQAQVEVFPHVRMALEDVTIWEPDGRTTFVSAQRLFLDLRIFPLLRQKVIAKRITLDHPRVRITRGADGRLNSADLFAPTQEGGFLMPLLGEELTITDGELVYEDAFQTPAVRTLTLRRIMTVLKAGPGEMGFRFFAAMPQETKEATLTVTGQIFRQTVQGPDPEGHATGRVEAKAVNLGQLASFLDDHALLRGLRAPADLTAAFDYRWMKSERSLAFTDLEVAGAGTTITGHAALAGLFSPHLRVTTSLTTTPFQVESLLESLPEEVLRSSPLGFLKEHQVIGTIQLVSCQVEWGPRQQPPLTVRGEVTLSGGGALVGRHRVPLSDVKGLLRFDADRMVIEHVTGRYGLAEVTAGRGEVTHLTEDPHFSLDINGKVSAPELAAMVVRFAPTVLLPDGLLGLSGLQGEAKVTVSLAGSVARRDNLQVDWDLEVKDVAFTDSRLNVPITGVQGKVRSIPRGVLFEHVTGLVGKSALVLDGEIAVHADEKTHYAVTVSGHADAQEVLAVATKKPLEKLAAAGAMEFVLGLSGQTGAIRGTGRVDLRQTELAHTIGLGKPKGVPGTVEFDLLVDPGRRLTLDRVVLEVPPLRLHSKGTVVLRGSRRFALDVRIPTVALRALPKGLLAMQAPPHAGSFQAKFSLTGLLDQWRAVTLKGRAAVKQAGFMIGGLTAPVEDLNLDLSFQGDQIKMERGTVKMRDSRIHATGTVRSWQHIPLVHLTLDSPALDLDLLVPKKVRTPVRAALERLSRSVKLSATASIRHGLYRGIPFDEIQAKVSGGDGVFVLDHLTARTDGGTLAGQLRMALPKEKPAAFESSLHVEKVAVEPWFRAFGIQEPPVTGALRLDGALKGDGSDPRGLSPTLNGDAQVALAKGHFRRLSATSKIIGILNLPTLLAGKVDFSDKGMPFECVSGRVSIKNGVAEIKDYLVDSPIMKIAGAGTYDIPNDRYEMVLAVSPFGSYEEFLKTIPLFGKLFVGEREGLVTAFFEVKGPVSDPQVSALPMQSVASGVTGLAQLAFDIMKNAILLPGELISPTEKTRSPCSAP